jgi:hypothetical protein
MEQSYLFLIAISLFNSLVWCFFISVKTFPIIPDLLKRLYLRLRAFFTFLFFVQKLPLKVRLQYRSIYDDGNEYYLLGVINCSHKTYYRVICGTHTTILPQEAIIIDDAEIL